VLIPVSRKARVAAGKFRARYSVRHHRVIILFSVLLIGLAGAARSSAAQDCPTSRSAIDPDRPDITNSPFALPQGSFQAENGVAWTAEHGSDVLDAAETRLRVGVAHCFELVIDAPLYSFAINGPASSGFSDVVASFKWQLPAVLELDSAAAAGIEFPSGSHDLSGQGYDPYLQWSWSRDIRDGWGVAGMFSIFWFTGRSSQNPTFEPTFEVTRDLLPSVGSFVEYVGDYPNHAQPSQVIDSGATWRIARLQQADLHFGFGLNRASPDHFIGFGYSFRLDDLF